MARSDSTPPAPKNDTPHTALSTLEKRMLHFMRSGKPVSRDVNREFIESASLGDQLADRVARFGGSWGFIGLFGIVLVGWIVLNSVILARQNEAFDPYPYILLNLCLSMISALQAPVIMMSQNRQGAKDRLDAAHDYEVNLKSEYEIATLHDKVDQLREQQWQALVAMQQEQIRLLTLLLEQRSTEKQS